MNKNCYVVIGVDGADYSVFKKMISIGMMPNLKKLIQNAVCYDVDTYGNARGQGWATMMTGLSPQEHGISYWKISHGTRSDDLSGQMLWDVIGKAGKTSGIMNLSYTFPPKPINGFMISGLGGGLGPSNSVIYSYPDGLIEELEKNADGYIWGLERGKGSIKQHISYIDQLIIMTKKRRKACQYLLSTKQPDFFMVVFRGADAIQHSFWKALELEGPAPGIMKDLKSRIRRYYTELDSAINDLWNSTIPKKRMIVSDHGFGPTTSFFRVNEFLCKEGLLFKNNNPKALIGNKLFHILKEKFGPFYRRYLSQIGFIQKLNEQRAQSLPKIEVAIDWDRTALYANNPQGIRFNNKFCKTESEKYEIFKKFKRSIDNFINPVTGKKLFKNIYLKEELGIKKFKDIAPDIIFDHNDESCLVTPELTLKKEVNIFQFINDNPLHSMSGSHRKLGVLIADPNYLKPAVPRYPVSVENIYPTILDSLNIDIPKYVKGESLLCQ